MMYGGKVKKMAQGGTTRTQSKIKDLGPNKGTKRTKGRRIVDVMVDEIFALSQSKSDATPAQKKEIDKRIAEKRAAIKANAPIDKNTGKALNVGEIAAGMDFPETFGKNVRYDKKMMGGGMAMKYKHGGTVGKKSKKCPRDGIAMRGKTRA